MYVKSQHLAHLVKSFHSHFFIDKMRMMGLVKVFGFQLKFAVRYHDNVGAPICS